MSDQYPREPVPDEAANRPARTVGMIVSNAVMGVPVIMLGASLGKDYGFPNALFVILLGCAITAGMASLAAVAGVRSRRSTALLAERTFGLAGARLLNIAVAIGLLGWLSVELGFIGQLVKSGAANGFGMTFAAWPGILIASACILAITITGFPSSARPQCCSCRCLACCCAGWPSTQSRPIMGSQRWFREPR